VHTLFDQTGLRGAIAYALSLHLEFETDTRQVIITTTLIIVLFSTLVFGGLTMPIVRVCIPVLSMPMLQKMPPLNLIVYALPSFPLPDSHSMCKGIPEELHDDAEIVDEERVQKSP
jgi:hypothetical protein